MEFYIHIIGSYHGKNWSVQMVTVVAEVAVAIAEYKYGFVKTFSCSFEAFSDYALAKIYMWMTSVIVIA